MTSSGGGVGGGGEVRGGQLAFVCESPRNYSTHQSGEKLGRKEKKKERSFGRIRGPFLRECADVGAGKRPGWIGAENVSQLGTGSVRSMRTVFMSSSCPFRPLIGLAGN